CRESLYDPPDLHSFPTRRSSDLNGYFYVFYTGAATNGGLELHDIVSRFQVSATNANRGDPDSELRLIAQYDPIGNHNAGDLHFRSEEHTSELQSRRDLVCRLLLE